MGTFLGPMGTFLIPGEFGLSGRFRLAWGCILKRDDLGDRLLPKSAMGKAVTDARNQWAALRRYVTDGRLTIDNNVSERTLRLQAIGARTGRYWGVPRRARVRRCCSRSWREPRVIAWSRGRNFTTWCCG